jgi:hypothetical protein
MRFPARGDDTHAGGRSGVPRRGSRVARDDAVGAGAARRRRRPALARASELLAQHRLHGAGGVVLTTWRAVALLRKCRGHLEQRHVMLRPQCPGRGDKRRVALGIGLRPSHFPARRRTRSRHSKTPSENVRKISGRRRASDASLCAASILASDARALTGAWAIFCGTRPIGKRTKAALAAAKPRGVKGEADFAHSAPLRVWGSARARTGAPCNKLN